MRRSKNLFTMLLFLGGWLCLPSMARWAAAEDAPAKQGLTNPFFAFDNGTGRGVLAPHVQAAMLKELGYAGIGYTGTKSIAEMLKALDEQNLKMFSIYVAANIGPQGPSYDTHLKEAIETLKGRDTLIWLTVRGKAPDGEKQAVQVVRQVADMAQQSQLRVALYPHYGFYVGRIEDALRVVKKVDRNNVGVTFNLCHWLKVGDQQNMELRMKQAMPYLFVVSINGADREGGWDRLIQTLDRGDFNTCKFVKRLTELGYTGPIGLQCYQVKGDVRENLARSMAAWRRFSARIAAEKK
jgi:sugar phosphate isomerase/epimerase